MEIIGIKNNYGDVLKKTAKIILAGGLVVFPSDTVYGLLVDPTNKKAVKKMLNFKNRWSGKGISIGVVGLRMAMEYVYLDKNEQKIYSNLLPGPFTIVSRGKHKVFKGIEAENGTLGIRIPNYKPILDLIKILKKPITLTSANLSGRFPHHSAISFLKTLSEKKKKMIDLIVDAGKLPKNKPSTVIDISGSEIRILRRGDLITNGGRELISKSEKETERIAEFLFKKILEKKTKRPLIFGLSGELGTGKTVFSRKIGQLFGIREKINSPTFVIYNEYKIKEKKFLHMDLYRITSERDLEEIKFFDLFDKNMIACIEWVENMGKKNLKKLKQMTNLVVITFEYQNQNTRKIKYKIN